MSLVKVITGILQLEVWSHRPFELETGLFRFGLTSVQLFSVGDKGRIHENLSIRDSFDRHKGICRRPSLMYRQ